MMTATVQLFGEFGLLKTLESIDAIDARPLLPEPFQGDLVQLFKLTWSDVLKLQFAPLPYMDVGIEGDSTRFRRLYVQANGKWMEVCPTQRFYRTIANILTGLSTGDGLVTAVLMIVGLPAPHMIDLHPSNAGSDTGPIYNLHYALR